MNKNIILLSDGTGNGSAKRNKTHVRRLYDALDLHRKDQVAFYDDGVGSQEFLPFKIIGGVFGWGLKGNVRELYKFLCRHYRTGDRIYLFGFSRGAFTVRMLAAMIDYCGVYTGSRDEKHLDRVARDSYNAFRSRFKTGWLVRALRLGFGKTEPATPNHPPGIEFIGVWDTVDAYGLPIDELAIIWDFLIYPIHFPDYKLSPAVKKACHALSVDDERHTFHPVLWDESAENDSARIEQVWFPGVHSDVGGGYPEYSLSLITLDWMIAKAEASQTTLGSPGLHLIEQRCIALRQHAYWHGPQHDSRALFGAYYRYRPRDIAALCNDAKRGIRIRQPKIHRSVMERICGDVVPYLPANLPEHYEVVATLGDTPEYETSHERKQRKTALQAVQKVIDLRRLLYFVFLLSSLTFLASPFLLGCWPQGRCTGTNGLLDSLLAITMRFMPGFTAPWMEVLRSSPGVLYGLVVLFGVLSLLKSLAWNKTRQLASLAWSPMKDKKRPH